jgi:hypothetical protein
MTSVIAFVLLYVNHCIKAVFMPYLILFKNDVAVDAVWTQADIPLKNYITVEASGAIRLRRYRNKGIATDIAQKVAQRIVSKKRWCNCWPECCMR